MDIAKVVALTEKVAAMTMELEKLIKSGAIQKDIDDQRAVIVETMDQAKEVLVAG